MRLLLSWQNLVSKYQLQLAEVHYIDTGASMSAVDNSIMQRLQINPIGQLAIGGVAGNNQHNIYPAKMVIPSLQPFNFASIVGVELKDHATPIVALIGRDVLSLCIFTYNGTTGSFSLAL